VHHKRRASLTLLTRAPVEVAEHPYSPPRVWQDAPGAAWPGAPGAHAGPERLGDAAGEFALAAGTRIEVSRALSSERS
jgi:hypothetical protein